MSPFAKNIRNPFEWSRFSKASICVNKGLYHQGNYGEIDAPREYNHYEGRYNAKYNIGVEIEAISTLPNVTLLPSNWFNYEEDGSLRGKAREIGGFSCEFVSHPIPSTIAQRWEQWDEVCKWMKKNEFKSWDWGNEICGLHIHIGREALGATNEEKERNLGKLIHLYYKLDTMLKNEIFGRGVNGWACDFSRELNTLQSVRALRENVTNEAFVMVGREKLNTQQKYHEINTMHSKTIEFRRGRGSLDAKRIACVCAFCAQICEYVRRTKDCKKLTQRDFLTYLNNHNKLQGNKLLEIIARYI